MVSKDYSFTTTASAAGVATITVTSSAQTWTVTQVSTECTAAPIGSQCRIRKNGSIISKMLAAGDVASGDPPVVIQPGDAMTVVWTGLTLGTVCKATVVFDNGL